MNTLDYYLIQTYFPSGEPMLNDYTKVFVYRHGAIVFEGSLQEYLTNFVPTWNSAEFAVVHDMIPDTVAYQTAHQAYLDKITELEAALLAGLYETRAAYGYNLFMRCFVFATAMVTSVRTIETLTPRTEVQYLALLVEKLDDVYTFISECSADIRLSMQTTAPGDALPLPDLQSQNWAEPPTPPETP